MYDSYFVFKDEETSYQVSKSINSNNYSAVMENLSLNSIEEQNIAFCFIRDSHETGKERT